MKYTVICTTVEEARMMMKVFIDCGYLWKNGDLPSEDRLFFNQGLSGVGYIINMRLKTFGFCSPAYAHSNGEVHTVEEFLTEMNLCYNKVC